MNADNTRSHAPWPFPAAGHFNRAATNQGPQPGLSEDDDDDEHDPAEQELVNEQLERDRNAAKAVDSKFQDGGRKA